ncbi:MAG TPA: BREX system ATP-binding domain-containing protein, partial [Polyangiales bacterium]|nr:BREX system ATP-binding domain-containing protein [Polyangiales bacterium]
MELVHGQRVFDYVRPHDQLDVVRLESVLTQLISAVTFLHAHGVIHRDLKPSNLLVENTGRLVVLDFGLARAIDDPSLGSSSGTHRYMSPERLRGQPANEASDWYSVGVILADMLSGSADDPSPHVVLASVATDSSTPAYLTQLCAQLISAGTPQRGPDTGKLLPPIARGLLPETVAASPFVGRAAELAALWRALQRVQEGNASVVLVHGEPGVGKTALARKFLRDVEHAGCAHVLTSRCHEAELIPYNAIDGLLDALAQHLQELAPERNELLESLAASELSTLFPALGAVLGVPAAVVPSNAQRHLVRERAFARLRELLDALSKSLPLVIHIDDIQWGDADSGKLLAALLEPPAPRVLIVAGFRTASGMSNPCVQTLRAVEVAQRGWVQELALHSFDELTSLELARVLVDPQSEARDLTIISRESGGNPLLLNALAQWHVRGGTRQAQPTLADLIDCVVIDLCALARELLKLIALAGRPLAHDVLARGVDGASTDEIEQQLVDLAHLGLTRNARGAARAVECYHDRIREIVVAGIPHQERQQLHAKLAAAAAAFEEPDSEFLALHYAGASALQEAAKHAQLAADHAFKTLAPEAAAELYLLALRCLEPAGPAALVEKAADALSFAGRCAEAAQLYLRTAEQSERHAAVRQQLRASQLLFHCGNLDQADAVTERLLAAIHIRVPASRWRKLLAIQLAVLRLRSGLLLAPKRRRGSDLDRLRADVCFAIGHTLATVDPARACLLIVQVLPSALREDADGRRARALAVYASLLSTLDSGTQRVQDELLAQALTLAKRSDDPEVLVWVRFSQAVTFIARSNFHRGL